jgi:hypothetical protein
MHGIGTRALLFWCFADCGVLEQSSFPQIVLFGDSLFQGCVDIADGFSFQAALQTREWLTPRGPD